MAKFVCSAMLLALISGCGGSKGSPTSPSTSSPTQTPTRVISLFGNMEFANIQLGQSFSATLNIHNTGNAPLTITGLTGSGGITSVTKADWTSGTIPASGSQAVRMTFTPAAPQLYTGTITVNGDQTSGTNSIAFSGMGQGRAMAFRAFRDSALAIRFAICRSMWPACVSLGPTPATVTTSF
jgi:HYDIN/CFA65/VesB family protein